MSVQYITAVLAQFDTNIAAIANEVVNPNGGGFKASAYRLGIDKEPDSAAEGIYYLDMALTNPKERFWGTGENIWTGRLTVQLGYYRGGGDGGGVDGGDRRSVGARANDDCMRLSDLCENPANYNRNVTGIRWIRYTGHRRAYDLNNYEVWEVGFDVEWRSDVTSTNTITASPGANVALLTLAGEWVSTDTVGEEDVVGQPAYFDFDDVSTWTNVSARLMAAAKVTGGTGTFNLRMGGTLGGSDGMIIATGTITGASYAAINLAGSAFVNPAGVQLLQVTFKNDTVGKASSIKGMSIGLRAS